MTGIPALTMRQVRLGLRDQDKERHWVHGKCWCKAVHEGKQTGLTLVAPPWDASRDGETAR
jgi:hypothetical protein